MAKKKKEKKEKIEKKRKIDFRKIFGGLKNINFKKLINNLLYNIKNFKHLERKKKIKMLGGFLLIILIFIGSFLIIPRFATRKLKIERNAKSASISNLFLYVPPDAFQYKKTFTIRPLKENSAEYQNLKTMGNFYGPIYTIIPDDNKEESSLKPIKIKYRIPMDLYYGDSFNNFSIMYASDDDPPIIKKLSGCEIFKDESLGTYVVQANTFHFSKFGLYVDPAPKEVSFGLKTLIEKPPSLEPDLLLVPGVDNNFLGFVPNTQSINNIYGENVWSLYFPNRTIWYYKYPLLETKPKSYMDAFFGYFIRTGSNSYLEFEAERFALELKTKQNKQFDIITQGIGSLIVRYALEKHPEIKNVRTISMFSPPNKGINTVNPIYFNIIYKKSPEIIELTYGLNKEEYNSLFLNISSKMDLISAYYKELLPDSDFIKKINTLPRRKDIKYYIYTGTIPDINIHIKNTKLATFYPEFINGYGDGLVTIESAKLDGAKFYTFEIPYNKLFSDNDVLKILQKNLSLGIQKVAVPEIKDDSFPETKKAIEETKVKEKLKKEEISKIFEKPQNYENIKLLNFSEQLLYLENIIYGKIYNLNGNILIASNKGVFDTDGNNILNKNVLGSLEYKNRLYITTNDGIYAIDNSSYEFIKIRNIDFNIHDNVFYLPEIRKYIYVDYSNGLAKIYENNNLIADKVIFNSLKVLNNNFYLVLGDKILKRTKDKWETVITKNGIKNIINTDFGYFTDYYSQSYYIYLLTSDYKLIVYNTKNHKVQILGNTDVGKFKLIENNNRLWVFDRNYVTYIDLENKIFPGKYQSISDYNIIDVATYKKDSFLLLIKKDRGFELWITDY
ncbi:hypothetical protein XO12_07310 [Marinitoga sp. 1154]|uniref:hypothetical protein n=1 Tax=Marinitoga sp. 1154 TaxID=1643335 RepID=UPI001586B019|nr:hypothetical protein [Marinitoga sp. 1154]NUU99907.1 hypothetical protein [Marinitoga sp. 1154]